MSEESHLLVERGADDVVIATLNRPRAKNTVSFAMWDAFAALLTEIEDGSPVRALVICGAENYFSSGGDLKTAPARGEGPLARGKRLEIGQRIIQRIAALPAPTIAAVEGGAWGFSWGLALACDMLIAGASAQFGAPFVDVGVSPDGGVAWQLTRQLGRRRALEVMLSNRVLDAGEALALGLASRVAPDGEALSAALDLARSLGKGNREATELAKRLVHQAEQSSLADNLALELAYCQISQGGEELVRAKAVFAARSAARKQG